jgi:hypothetical protein
VVAVEKVADLKRRIAGMWALRDGLIRLMASSGRPRAEQCRPVLVDLGGGGGCRSGASTREHRS